MDDDEVVKRTTGLDWQSIESAPAGGTPVLVWHEQWPEPRLIAADGDWWRYAKKVGWFTPSHWMPLPPPPTKGGAE